MNVDLVLYGMWQVKESMMHRPSWGRPVQVLLASGLTLLSILTARADLPYQIEPILQGGVTIDGVKLSAAPAFEVSSLNERGEFVFLAKSATGVSLLQYIDGQIVPIRMVGGDAPGGKWPRGSGVVSHVSMNQHGDAVFTAPIDRGGEITMGTFLWSYPEKTVTPIALKGMVADNITLEQPTGFNSVSEAVPYDTPVINNRNEIAFAAVVKDAQGKYHTGIFFRGQDGQLRVIAAPDQPLPDGSKVVNAWLPSIDDKGRVLFHADRSNPKSPGLYVWENGTITPMLLSGGTDANGDTIVWVVFGALNNKNQAALVQAQVLPTRNRPPSGQRQDLDALYLWSGGVLNRILATGQEMPGGGKLKALMYVPGAISYATEAGQYAFVAKLDDDSTAAYRVELGGTLSLILKSGTETPLGKISRIGKINTNGSGQEAVSINSVGQVALAVQIEGGQEMLLLLTPSGQAYLPGG